jgi:hypothetical protein
LWPSSFFSCTFVTPASGVTTTLPFCTPIQHIAHSTGWAHVNTRARQERRHVPHMLLLLLLAWEATLFLSKVEHQPQPKSTQPHTLACMQCSNRQHVASHSAVVLTYVILPLGQPFKNALIPS